MARTDPRPHYGQMRRERDDGYIDIWLPGHPVARRDGYAMEHRVMAWDAGLLTDLADQVHHQNEIRGDNRIENFEVKSAQQHTLDHAEERGYVTNQYGTFAVKPVEERQSSLYGQVRLQRLIEPCKGCGGQIPPTCRRDAKYCSSSCRVNAWKRAH